MKKILFLTLFAAGITATAQVKVGTNPTTLATNANLQVEGTTTAEQFVVLKNGNVGIGTTAPGAKLAVNGGIVVGNGDTNNGALSVSDGLIFGASGSGEGISSKRTAGAGQFALNFYTTFANRMSILSNGNVGIGTTAPTERLEVQGGALISSLAGTGSRMVTASATGVLGTAAIPVANSKFTNDATNARVFLTNLSDGVTARPTTKNFFITDAGQLLMGAQSDASARVVINSEDALPIALVAASKNADNRSGFGLIGAFQQANYEGTGLANEVVASKAISIAQVGSGTIGNLSSVKAWSLVRSGYTGTIINQHGVDVDITNDANTGTINNLVGVNIIGLDNPLAAGRNRYGLRIGDVVGSTYQAGGEALAIKTGRGKVSLGDAIEVNDLDTGDRPSYLDLHASNGLDYSARILRDGGVNGDLNITNTGTGNINVDLNGEFNLVNSSVLGTTAGSVSPVATFVGLAGNFSAMDFRTRRHTAGTDWTGTNTRLQKRIDGSDFGFIDFGIDGRSGGDGVGLGFGAEGSTHMVVNRFGNVGIGTTNPGAKLAVNGGIVVGNGDTNNGALSNSDGLIFGASGSGEGISSKRTAGVGQFALNFYTTFANRMTILSNGKVGIGTIDPNAKLDIVNDLGFNPGANDLAAIKVSGSYGGGIVFAEGAKRSSISAPFGDSLSFSTGGTTAAGSTERMVILSNGNVGIGLTGPATSKLQVAGLPIHASNAAALTAGLTAGAFFHNGDGILRVVF